MECLVTEEVLELAKCVRSWAERRRFVHNFNSDLKGMCAIASAHLHRALELAGIKSSLVGNSKHVFLLMEGGFILDITATQFSTDDTSYPKTLHMPHPLALAENPTIWKIDYQFNFKKDLNTHLTAQGWLPYQLPIFLWDEEFLEDLLSVH